MDLKDAGMVNPTTSPLRLLIWSVPSYMDLGEYQWFVLNFIG
jgi:hypothetical protein